MESTATKGNASGITLTVQARSDLGRVRTNNEDAFSVADLSRDEATERDMLIDLGPRGALLAVSDGMGGAAFGEIAARVSLAALRNALADRLRVASPERAMRESVEVANTAVFDAARAPDRKGMGATLVAAFVQGAYAYSRVRGGRGGGHAAMSDVCLVLESVSKTYGPIRAVVRVSAQFLRERVSVIEGANGPGKSTLLALCAGLARPTSGRVTYGPLARTRMDLRSRLGWCGTESHLYADLTARENVTLAARLHAVDAKGAWERSAGLDAGSTALLAKVIREERARGTSVVVVTHDAAFARRIEDDRYAMEAGVLRRAA